MRLIRDVPRRELALLLGAMAMGFILVVVYVIAIRPDSLAGDQGEYDLQGEFFTMGKWWWSTTPYGIAHASMWKAPLYPLWVGFWYEVLGSSPLRVELVQAFLAPVTIGLTWLLARHLFSPRVAIASAWVVAVFPLVWEYYGLLYPEALAIPLTMLVLVLVLGQGEPGPGRAALVGAVVGVSMLLRPNSFFLFAAVAVSWIIAAGWRRGAAMTGVAIAISIIVVAPWTFRNYQVSDGGFVPISVQDGALYGTFNEESASDPIYPYAWRAVVPSVADLLDPPEPLDDAELRSRLQDRAFDYIADHPDSVPKAFFWNGLSRFWDVRRPGRALDEVPFQGRSRPVTATGLAMYYLLLPLALIGLWRVRHRREVAIPVLALALGASIVFTVIASTRYRAPLEPLIVILACSLLATWPRRGPAGAAPDRPLP